MEVKLLRREGHSALVEWFDGVEVRRGIIPVRLVDSGYVEREELERAIPYGEAWEELVELKATPELLARELRKVGIWTVEDLRQRPNEALAALMATYKVDYHILLKSAYRKQ